MIVETGLTEWLDKKQTEFENLTNSQRNEILGVFNKQACDVKNLLMAATGWDRDKINLWMKLRNPMLGEISPLFMIATGRGEKLLSWMKTQIDENSPTEQSSSARA